MNLSPLAVDIKPAGLLLTTNGDFITVEPSRMPLRPTVSLDALRYGDRPRPAALVTAGRFDKAAIMRKAVGIARSLRTSALTWGAKMRIGLTTTWKAAHEERAVAANYARPVTVAWTPALALPRAARPVRTWTSGARAYSHGW